MTAGARASDGQGTGEAILFGPEDIGGQWVVDRTWLSSVSVLGFRTPMLSTRGPAVSAIPRSAANRTLDCPASRGSGGALRKRIVYFVLELLLPRSTSLSHLKPCLYRPRFPRRVTHYVHLAEIEKSSLT